MSWKSYAVMSGATTLLAAYVASPPLLVVRQGAAATSPQHAATASSQPDVDIVREAARLEGRLRAEAAFRAPARNPFRFADERLAAPHRAAGTAFTREEAAPPPAAEELPVIVLSGIGTDVVNGATVRTAVITTASSVLLARVGDMVGAEYRVRTIREDAVELESVGDGSIRSIGFPADLR
jgi:Tfp pilus assembly protein PilP